MNKYFMELYDSNKNMILFKTISELIDTDIYGSNLKDTLSKIQELFTTQDSVNLNINDMIDKLTNADTTLTNNKIDNVTFADDILSFKANGKTLFEIILNIKKRDNSLYSDLQRNKRTQIVGHRGLSCAYPENTLLAIKESALHGATMCEFDVAITSDNEFILMHDDTVDRTTNGNGNTNTLTLAQIKNLVIDGGSNADYFSGLKVPTLKEALITCKTYNITPFIELKNNVPISLIPKYVELIKSINLGDKCITTSFNHELLNEVQKVDSNLIIAPIMTFTQSNITPWLNRNNVCFSVQYPNEFNESCMTSCHNKNIPIFVWTVDNESDIKYLCDIGVDGIISNAWNNKKYRQALIVNGADATQFFVRADTFGSDYATVSKLDTNTLRVTWAVPFYSRLRPLGFGHEDSGDKIGYVPITKGAQKTHVDVRLRRGNSLDTININSISEYAIYFGVSSRIE